MREEKKPKHLPSFRNAGHIKWSSCTDRGAGAPHEKVALSRSQIPLLHSMPDVSCPAAPAPAEYRSVRAEPPGHLSQPTNCHDALVTLAHVPWDFE